MSDDTRLIFRIIGSLILLLWVLSILRKMYYNPTREARFLFSFIILTLAGKLVTLWLDVQVLTASQNVSSLIFNNVIFIVPVWFYFKEGSKDKQKVNTFELQNLSNLNHRAENALEASDVRIKCSN